ncbi:MAG: efflux RND transporter periplasmic adaptor subunit [Gammaproteobacteria bacterium]|nr:efflux RND transporter periplasmic adaptor subunit [Gammaproteobacteria bacterium]
MRRDLAAWAAAALAAVALIIAIPHWFAHRASESPAANMAARVPVRVALALRGPLASWITGAGTVRAVNSALIRARVDGLIERVYFHDGQRVARGTLLFELDAKPFAAQLAAARAQRARDVAQLDNAHRDFRRYDELLRKHSTSAQTRDTALALVRELEASVAYDTAQVALARLNLSYTAIRAPFAGTIGSRLVDPGNLVHLNDTGGLAIIDQVQPIYVEFTVPQDRLTEIRAAYRHGPVPVEARAPNGGAVLGRGRLIFVDNQIDAATGTLACRARFDNGRRSLWPGEFVEAALRLRTIIDAVTVPAEAVQPGPDGLLLYVVGPDSVARRRSVRAGITQDGRTEITSGLAGGERVVTRGEFRLDAVTPVRIEAN